MTEPPSMAPSLTVAEKNEIAVILALKRLEEKGISVPLTKEVLARILEKMPSTAHRFSTWNIIQDVSNFGRIMNSTTAEPSDQFNAAERLMRTVAGMMKLAILNGGSAKQEECVSIMKHIQGVLLTSKKPLAETTIAILKEPLTLCLQKSASLSWTDRDLEILIALVSAPFEQIYTAAAFALLERISLILPDLTNRTIHMAVRDKIFADLHRPLQILEAVLCKSPYSSAESAQWRSSLPALLKASADILEYPLVFMYLKRITERVNFYVATVNSQH